MLVSLSSADGCGMLVVPRTETGTVAVQTTGIQSALLKNLYAKATDLQITPDATSGTPSAIYGVPDSIELNSTGIPGGYQQARLCGTALNNRPLGYYTFPIIQLGRNAND